MHVTSERLEILDRRARKHTVSEIEDVPPPSGRAPKHVVGCRQKPIARAEEQRRIEIALDPALRSNRGPRIVEPLAPVHADHVPARVGEIRENRSRPDAEVNHRHAGSRGGVEDLLRVRKRELAVVAPAERAGPRVEDLQCLRAGLDLRRQVIAHAIGEHRTEPVPRRSLLVHERLGAQIVARRSSLDGVRREGERRSAKPDQGHLALELAPEESNGFEHVRQRLARLESRQPVDVRRGFDRVRQSTVLRP